MTVKDWRSELLLRLEDFVDTFVVKGAKQQDVYDAIAVEIGTLRVAHGRDPGPAADDVSVDEPANDWPAAD